LRKSRLNDRAFSSWELIKRGRSVADQIPGLLHRQTGGMGDHQIHALAAIGPEAHTAEASALPAAQLQFAHLAAQRRCGAVDFRAY